MWIDAHAHLAELSDSQLLGVMESAGAAGVETVLNTGTDLASSARAVAQSRLHTSLRAAAGISPFDAEHVPADWPAQLRNLLLQPSVVALGEVGLDASNPRYPSLEAQMPLFEQQLALACELDLPAVVHSRGAESTVVDVCRAIGAERVVFHCFTGTSNELRKLLDAGYWVSFSGIVTFPSSHVPELVRAVPLERLLVETDTPYLSPVPFRGRPNEPSRVAVVGQAVASLRGMAPEHLAGATRAAFSALF